MCSGPQTADVWSSRSGRNVPSRSVALNWPKIDFDESCLIFIAARYKASCFLWSGGVRGVDCCRSRTSEVTVFAEMQDLKRITGPSVMRDVQCVCVSAGRNKGSGALGLIVSLTLVHTLGVSQVGLQLTTILVVD